MHRHPPRAFYTHYYNIYSLKLLPLTLYQRSIQQKRITIIYIKKIITTAISTAKKKNVCLPKRHVMSLPFRYAWQTRLDGMTFKWAWGLVVQRPWRKPTWQAETIHAPRTTFHLPLPLPLAKHQPWQPKLTTTLKINETTVNERVNPIRAIHWVVNLIFNTIETHDNAHAPTTRIITIFTVLNSNVIPI